MCSTYVLTFMLLIYKFWKFKNLIFLKFCKYGRIIRTYNVMIRFLRFTFNKYLYIYKRSLKSFKLFPLSYESHLRCIIFFFFFTIRVAKWRIIIIIIIIYIYIYMKKICNKLGSSLSLLLHSISFYQMRILINPHLDYIFFSYFLCLQNFQKIKNQ